jgi:hypothetical protein
MGLVSLDSARGCGRKSNSGSDMAYGAYGVFDIYLGGLSNNNVIIDEAFDVSDPVQRWRLYCEKCGATLTYSDVSVVEMAHKYKFESIVDAKVSAFCKAHCHQVKHDTVKMYDDVYAETLLKNGKINAATVTAMTAMAAEATAAWELDKSLWSDLPSKNPLPIQIVKLAPIPIIKTTPAPEYPTPLPLKRSGRKVR